MVRSRVSMLAAVVLALIAGAATAGYGWLRPDPHRYASTSEALLDAAPGPRLVWVGEHEGRVGLITGPALGSDRRRLADLPNACGTCPLVVSDEVVLFDVGASVWSVDLSTGAATPLADGLLDQAGPHAAELPVISGAPTRLRSTFELIDRTGTTTAGPWTAPEGFLITAAGQSAALLHSDAGMMVWQPRTRQLTPVPDSHYVASYTSRDRQMLVLAPWAPACLETDCGLVLVDLITGSRDTIPPPTADGYYLGGGAVSPDGRHLAALVVEHPDARGNNRTGRVAIIDLATRKTTILTGIDFSFGEPRGWAAWSPDSQWLIAGGIDGVGLHRAGTTDAVRVLPAMWNAGFLPDDGPRGS